MTTIEDARDQARSEFESQIEARAQEIHIDSVAREEKVRLQEEVDSLQAILSEKRSRLDELNTAQG